MAKHREGYIRFDPKKVKRRQAMCGLSDATIIGKGISKESLAHIKAGSDIWLDTAVKFQRIVGADDLFSLMAEDKLVEYGGTAEPAPGISDWTTDSQVSGPITAANGLKWFVWKMKHRVEKDRYARAKHYQLAGIPTDEQERMVRCLRRHWDICNLIAKKSHALTHFPRHITSVPDPKGDAWWIIDEWVDGQTLSEPLGRGPLASAILPRVMREIAEGLQALHEQDIVRRELSPQFIFLSEPKGTVLLTDFELGKLFDGEPTVGKGWKESLYRAPEVGDEPLTKEDKHVDLYSWGRILVQAATGGLPARNQEAASLDVAPLPPRVREIGKRCLLPAAAGRPHTIDEVLKAIRGWK